MMTGMSGPDDSDDARDQDEAAKAPEEGAEPETEFDADGVVRAFLQGEAVLADVYQLEKRELFEIAEQGRTFFESGQVAKAQKVFEGLTALDPYESNFHVGLGAVCQKQGELDRALLEYDRAVQLNQHDIPALTNRAEVLVEKGELVSAVESLRVVLELDPAAEHPHTARARGLAVALSKSIEESQKN